MSAPTPQRTEEEASPAVTAAPTGQRRAGRAPARVVRQYAGMPLFLLAALAGLYFYVADQQLGAIEQTTINTTVILSSTIEHLQLVVVSTALVIAIAVPLGILLTRPFARQITPPALAVANTGQAVPSIGLLALLAVIWTIGFRPAIVALVAYAALPVLRNTMVGLHQVSGAVIEAGRGMGMSRLAVLRRIELPLAVPVILAGVRTALVINVGTATLAALIGAGGLGVGIIRGIVNSRPTITVVFSVLTAVLALGIDYLGGIAEDLLRPRGL